MRTITVRPAPVSQDDRRRLFRAALAASRRMVEAIARGDYAGAEAQDRAARLLRARLRAAPAKDGSE